MNLYSRIKGLADSKKVSIAELERKTGISNGQIRHWTDRSPKAENLQKVADYFSVSTDYLLGRNDTPEWATEKDTHDLEEFLEQNEGSMTYGGEKLTEEDKEKLKIAMTQIFWRRHKHD